MKKTWKRLCALFLAVVMTLSLLPTAAFAADGVSTQADGDLRIPGYTRVTEMPVDGLEAGKYLIVAASGGSYYMLYPGGTGGGSDVNDSARLVVNADGEATGYKVGHSTDTYDSATESHDWVKAENVISPTEGTRIFNSQTVGVYAIEAVGQVTNNPPYYLCSTGTVYSTTKGETKWPTIQESTAGGSFIIRNGTPNYSHLVFYAPNENFSQYGTPNSDCVANMMLFKSNVGANGHIAPLGNVLIGNDDLVDDESKWSKTNYTIDSTNHTASITTGGPNNHITWNGTELDGKKDFLIQFDIAPKTTGQDDFKVRLMNDGGTTTTKWLQVRFGFATAKKYVLVETANQAGSNQTGMATIGTQASFEWDVNATDPYPVDVLLKDGKVSVYWNGSLLLDEVVIPDAQKTEMTVTKLSLASEWANQNHTISNLVVSTDEGVVTPPPETPDYTDDNVNAGLFDVGANPVKNAAGEWVAQYRNPSNSVIVATASSWNTSTTNNDRGPEYAVDGIDVNPVWHSNYGTGTEENPNQSTIVNDVEKRWIQLEIQGDEIPWLTGLRYVSNNGASTGGNGNFIKCEVRVSNNGTDWSVVTPENNEWTRQPTVNGKVWKYVAFNMPVQAKYVRLYAVETSDQTAGQKNRYMNAAEVRLVKAENQEPATHNVTITVTEKDANPTKPLANMTVAVTGQDIKTTDASGQAVFNLVDGSTYTVTVSDPNHGYRPETDTITPAEDETALGIELTEKHHVISGTVTVKVIDEKTQQEKTVPLEGATVTLVNADTGFTTLVNGPTALTGNDGTYELNVNAVAAGNYKVRASKPGYDAAIFETAVEITDEEASHSHGGNNLTLNAIDVASAKFKYDMSDADNQPELGFSDAATKPTYEYVNGELKLSFPNTARMNNLVKLVGTGVKNGTIEFDATRVGSGVGRFGLALRLTESNNWIFVGQWDSNTTWASEYWYPPNGDDYSRSSVQGPSFGNGDTRHFKVTIEDNQVTLVIDGIQVYSQDLTVSGATVPSVAADVGFICGNNGTGVPCDIYIDNLYIFRKDDTHTVTLDTSNTDVTLSAKISTSAGEEDLGLEDEDNEESLRNQAAEGDVIVIRGTPAATLTGKALGAVIVKDGESNDISETVNVELNVGVNEEGEEDCYFTFTMPAYPVTVYGELKDTFTAELPKTEGDNPTTVAPQVGKEYEVTVSSGAMVTYQWYVETSAGSGVFEAITGQTNASIEPDTDREGHKLQVVVTGTGDYTGIKTLTTEAVLPPDVEVESVTLQRHAITMWTNDESKSSDENDLEVGKNVDMTATISPENPTKADIAWTVKTTKDGEEVDGSEIVSVEQSETNPKQATLTAKKAGTATVTVTVTSANGTKYTDSCVITVKTKPEGVSVSTGEGDDEVVLSGENADPLVLWTNDLSDKTPSSATLTAELTAGDGAEVSEKGLKWEITKNDNDVHMEVSADEDDSTKATIRVLDVTMDNVGEVTVTVTSTTDPDVSATFKVIVKRQIETNIRISGTPKFGEKLGWSFLSDVGGKANLTYQWYRLTEDDMKKLEPNNDENDENGENGETPTLESLLTDERAISGKTGDTTGADDKDVSYTLTAEDIGSYIAVKVVPADDNEYYVGTKTAVTDGPVERADASAKPELDSVKLSAENAKDGKIIITNWDENATYEILAPVAEGEEAKWASANVTDETVIIQGEDGETTITRHVIAGLDAGNYQVRIGETDTEKASDPVDITVPEANATTYRVLLGEIQHGTIRRSPTSAVATARVNITVTPDAGYALKSLTATYMGEKPEPVEGDDETEPVEGDDEPEPDEGDGKIEVELTEVKDENDKVIGYYFVMPAADVTISAEFELTKITITHTLDHLTCSLYDENDPTADKHEVDWGTVNSITLTPDEGYTWPETITVLHDDNSPCEEYTYRNGVITFDEGALERDITITADGEQIKYAVRYALTNLSSDSSRETMHGATYTGTLTANTGYDLPKTIIVVMDGNILTAKGDTPDYTYDSETGEITIKKVVNNVVISAVGERTTTPVEMVEITIGHADPGTAEKTTPHVDDTLTAKVTPSAASVTYQWIRVNGTTETEITGATTMNYTVTADDQGKTIKVKVVGAGDYNGEKTATTKNAVGPRSVATTGVSLNEFTHSMSVGQSFTLTATVQPETATNRAVTWKVINDQNVDITDESIVKLTDNEDGTATVEGKGVGTVRVVATNAGGQTARCVVTVERANQYTLNYMVRNDTTDTVNVTFTTDEGLLTSGSSVVAGTEVTVAVTGVNAETNVANVTVTANNQTSNATDNEDGTWTFAMPGYETLAVVSITAKPVAVTGVTLSQDTATVGVGKSFGLIAHVEPGDAANQAVTWSSDDKDVATVTQQGLVTGVAEGTATITVTTADGNHTAECKVTVAVDKATLNIALTTAANAKDGVVANAATDIAEVAAGTRYTAQANIDTLDAAIATAQGIADKQDATQEEVDAQVTALNAAVATFNSQVKIGTKLPDVDVEDVSLTLSDGTAIPAAGVEVAWNGKTIQLAAVVVPENATNKKVSWSSSDPTKATVSNTGLVTGVAVGETTITVTTENGKKTASCKVTVGKADVETAAAISFTGRVQEGKQLTANVSGVPEGDLDFQWILVDGGTETNISGATSKTYTVQSIDVGKTLKVKVTAQGTSTDWKGSYTSQATTEVLGAGVQYYSVTATLNDASTTAAVPEELPAQSPLTITLTIDEAAYAIESVTVTMGGTEIDVYTEANKTIAIDHVTGDVVITVTTRARDYAKLASLTLSSGTLAPAFDADTLTYTATVDSSLDSVTITAAGADGATATVKKGDATCAGGVVALDDVSTVVTITVSKDDKDDQTYTVTIIRTTVTVPVESITISAADDANTVKIGSTLVLTATVSPDNASNKNVIWTSSDDDIATVAGGVVSGLTAGTVTITATSEANSSIKGEYTVTVVTVPVEDVSLQTTATIEVGDVYTLIYSISPSDATDKTLTWVSGDEDVVTVDNGVITGVSAGTATITATTTDGTNISKTCTVTVNAQTTARLDSLSLKTADNTAVSLNRDFVNSILSYTANVAYSVDSVTVAATAADSTVVVKKGDDTCTDGVVDLDVGENVITITVSKTDLEPKVYTVIVTRAPAGQVDASAENVTVVYDGASHGITVNVTDPSDDYTITYSADEDGTYGEAQPECKNVGEYTIWYKVEADGYTTLTGSATVTITQAAGLPAPWTLEGVAPASETATKGKITGLVGDHDYEVTAALDQPWTKYHTNSEGEIEIAPGSYYVREVQDNNHEPNTHKPVTVPPYGVKTYTIDRISGITNGSILDNAGDTGIVAGTLIRLVVQPNTGYRYVDRSLKVTYTDENGQHEFEPTKVPAGQVYEGHEPLDYDFYYFTMPAANVTITAEFEKISYTVTVNVINGINQDPKTVEHGASFTITVGATGSYKLPDTITVNMGGTALTAGEGYNYDKTSGEIKIDNVTADVTITVTCVEISTPTPPPVIPSGPSTPSTGDDTKTETKENEDGTTTTIVTDNKTGTVTETTEKEDGTVEVVETKKDGTVTETTTDPEGGKVEKVTNPDKDVAITVTDKDGEVLAKVELPAEIPEPETRFVDVPEGHWADEAIHNMAALEVVNGVGGDRYNMNGNMTRGALATVLRRMSHGQEGLEASFADVDADKWYADGIAWAARVGVVTGRSADTFAPDDTITREELAVMLCRYARLLGIDTTADSATLDSFKDGSSTHSWAADSIAWCVENGILKGMGNDTLAPTATATRAQVAVMLQRFIDLMK